MAGGPPDPDQGDRLDRAAFLMVGGRVQPARKRARDRRQRPRLARK